MTFRATLGVWLRSQFDGLQPSVGCCICYRWRDARSPLSPQRYPRHARSAGR